MYSLDKIIFSSKQKELPFKQIEHIMSKVEIYWNKKGFFVTYESRPNFLNVTYFRKFSNIILGLNKRVETILPRRNYSELKFRKIEYINIDDELWTQ